MADPGTSDTASPIPSRLRSSSRRLWSFVALCAAMALVAGGYTARAIRRNTRAASSAAAPSLLATPPARPYLIVRSTTSDDTWRRLLLVPLAAPAGGSYATPLTCDRAYFAGNRGVCLVEATEGILTRHYAEIFDEHFTRLHRLPLTGLPSRTRVSADGRRASITVFEQGHSYAEAGFSTRTTIVDTIGGRVLGDLEQFTIWRDGQRFRAVDFNFWGVTFAQDGNRFFVTLASGGVKYLIEGNVDAREGRVMRTGVECPSLSPDNTRIAHKHLIGGAGMWQLRVYDLRTGAETALTSEARTVDDQVDWLDNDHVMYHITGTRGADIWVLRTDNTQPPQMLRQYAYSPAVVR
jgi:hypothetical protein